MRPSACSLQVGRKTLAEVTAGAPPVQSVRLIQSLLAEFPHLAIEQSDLHLSSCVGKGAFADVYKATWRGEVVAVKQLRHKGSYAINIMQRLANEIRILWCGAEADRALSPAPTQEAPGAGHTEAARPCSERHAGVNRVQVLPQRCASHANVCVS